LFDFNRCNTIEVFVNLNKYFGCYKEFASIGLPKCSVDMGYDRKKPSLSTKELFHLHVLDGTKPLDISAVGV